MLRIPAWPNVSGAGLRRRLLPFHAHPVQFRTSGPCVGGLHVETHSIVTHRQDQVLIALTHRDGYPSRPGVPDDALVEHADLGGPAGQYVLQHAGLVPGRVLVSPALRTRETWECLGPALAVRVLPGAVITKR